MDLSDVEAVVNSEAAGTLSLSKGGWEGWLQCELWRYLSIVKQETVERELPYPGSSERCDLVVGTVNPKLWVEIKAFGIFREGDTDSFLDSIARDIRKIAGKPVGNPGLALVVVPKGIGEAFKNEMVRRRWLGFEERQANYANIYYMNI